MKDLETIETAFLNVRNFSGTPKEMKECVVFKLILIEILLI